MMAERGTDSANWPNAEDRFFDFARGLGLPCFRCSALLGNARPVAAHNVHNLASGLYW
jgi:hypothetical protein